MRRKRRNFPRGRAGFGTLLGILLIALVLVLAERQGLLDPAVPAGGSRWEDVSAGAIGEAGTEGLEVYFLDVGQGDSELIRIPENGAYFNALIDTGEYAYADGLTEALKSLGVERIDALICSHPHTDHMGCMARIVQRFEIGKLYMPRLPDDIVPTTSAYEALLNAMEKKGLTAVQLCEDVEIPCPAGASFQVAAPRRDADWEDVNNYSAVLRFTYGGVSFLFTGDAEKESEKLILQDGYDVSADVLKCGHHGSSTSTSAKFLKAVAPKYAVISCGQDNQYGHPHKGTLEKLEKLGAALYRTDEDGTILARSDGETVTFETGLPSVQAAW